MYPEPECGVNRAKRRKLESEMLESELKEDRKLLADLGFKVEKVYQVATQEGLILSQGNCEKTVITNAAFRWRSVIDRIGYGRQTLASEAQGRPFEGADR